MKTVFPALLAWMASAFRSRAAMQIEILALHHQLATYRRSAKRPRIKPADGILWSWIAREEAGFFTAFVLGLLVMLRAKAPPSVIKRAARVAIEHLEALRA
jgi:hypothetical protein